VFRDIIGYLILGVQCLVMISDVKYSFAISVALFVLLLLYNFKYAKDIVSALIQKVKAKKG